MTGTVKWFNVAKGFGFITSEEGQEVFCHFSGIISSGFRSLNEGQKVEFKITIRPNGPEAYDIIVIPESSDSE